LTKLSTLAIGNRAYSNKTCHRGLKTILESAEADFALIAAVLTARGKGFVSQSGPKSIKKRPYDLLNIQQSIEY
jgi:hypothetical protein